MIATTGIDERYAEEWLEQQAISGLLDVAEPGPRSQRRYALSAAQHLVLSNDESPFYAGGLALLAGGCGVATPRLPDLYRTGAGMPFADYGDDIRLGQGLFNRGAFLAQLTQDWIPALGIADLLAKPAAAALDLGCGVGWSAIALANAFAGLTVLGLDSDEASILDARRNAVEAGVADRVRFEVAQSDQPLSDSYDVAFYFESLHDMGHPIESLRAVRAALKPGGAVGVMDERAEDEFAPHGSPLERLFATASVLHCLPVGRSEDDSAATGCLFRPRVLREYATRAGFASIDVAPIEHDVFRFYLLR